MFKIQKNYAQTDNRKERKNVAPFKSAFSMKMGLKLNL